MDWFFGDYRPDDASELDDEATDDSNDESGDDAASSDNGSGSVAGAATPGGGGGAGDDAADGDEDAENADRLYGHITTVEAAQALLSAKGCSDTDIASMRDSVLYAFAEDVLPDSSDGDQWRAAFFLLKKNVSLKQLVVRDCPSMSGGAGLLVGDLVRSSPTLRELTVDNTRMGDEGAEMIGAGVRMGCNLRTLEILRSGIGDEGAEHLSKALRDTDGQGGTASKKLHTLRLGGNSIGDKGLESLAKLVASKRTPVRTLSLARNAFGDFGCAHLADGLKFGSQLKRIDLSGNKVGVRGVSVLTMAAKSNTNLIEVTLSVQPKLKGAVLALKAALKSKPCIERVAGGGVIRHYDNGDQLKSPAWQRGPLKGIYVINTKKLDTDDVTVLWSCVALNFLDFAGLAYVAYALQDGGNWGGSVFSAVIIGAATLNTMYTLWGHGKGRRGAVESQLLWCAGFLDMSKILGVGYVDNITVDPNDDRPKVGVYSIMWLKARESMTQAAPQAVLVLTAALRWGPPKPAVVVILAVLLSITSFWVGAVMSDREAILGMAARNDRPVRVRWNVRHPARKIAPKPQVVEGQGGDADVVDGSDGPAAIAAATAASASTPAAWLLSESSSDSSGGSDPEDPEAQRRHERRAIARIKRRAKLKAANPAPPEGQVWTDLGTIAVFRLAETASRVAALAMFAAGFQLMVAAAIGIEAAIAWGCMGFPLSIWSTPVALYAAFIFPGFEHTMPPWLTKYRAAYQDRTTGIISRRLLYARCGGDFVLVVGALAGGNFWFNPLFSQSILAVGLVVLIVIGLRVYYMPVFLERMASLAARLGSEEAAEIPLPKLPPADDDVEADASTAVEGRKDAETKAEPASASDATPSQPSAAASAFAAAGEWKPEPAPDGPTDSVATDGAYGDAGQAALAGWWWAGDGGNDEGSAAAAEAIGGVGAAEGGTGVEVPGQSEATTGHDDSGGAVAVIAQADAAERDTTAAAYDPATTATPVDGEGATLAVGGNAAAQADYASHSWQAGDAYDTDGLAELTVHASEAVVGGEGAGVGAAIGDDTPTDAEAEVGAADGQPAYAYDETGAAGAADGWWWGADPAADAAAHDASAAGQYDAGVVEATGAYGGTGGNVVGTADAAATGASEADWAYAHPLAAPAPIQAAAPAEPAGDTHDGMATSTAPGDPGASSGYSMGALHAPGHGGYDISMATSSYDIEAPAIGSHNAPVRASAGAAWGAVPPSDEGMPA